MGNLFKYYIALIFTFTAFMHIAYANTYGDIEVGLVSDDNLTRSDYSEDMKADTALEVYADYGNFYELSNNWSATASVFGQLLNYSKYTNFSSINLGVAGSARKKLGLGAYSSAIKVTASIGISNVKDSNRSSTFYGIGAGWDKRLNDRWLLAAGINLDQTNAKTSTYDSSSTTYYVSADYTINNSLILNLGISQRHGDIVTITNSTKNPTQKTYKYLTKSTSKYSSDSVFGAGLTAYNISADTQILKIGLSYALDNNSSINAGYENQNSSLPYGVSYKNNIFTINYSYRF